MLLSLGLILAASTVAVHAEESRDLPPDDVRALLGMLSSAIQRRTEQAPVVQPFAGGSPCTDRSRCLLEVLHATGAREVVPVRILAVPSRIRVIAELRNARLDVLRRAQVDLAREPSQWPASLDAMALALFPANSPPSLTPALDAAPEARPRVAPPLLEPDLVAESEVEPRRWPWWLVGGGAVAGGVAIALGVENASARDEGERSPLPPARVEALQDTTRATGLGANILFGVAATSIITGAVFLVLGD